MDRYCDIKVTNPPPTTKVFYFVFILILFQLTWADLYFAAITDLLSNVLKDNLLAPYPSLAALKEKVDSLPSISAYREKRPKGTL